MWLSVGRLRWSSASCSSPAASAIVGLFVGEGEERVVDMAAHYLLVNGVLYVVLGVLFVLRGALQGLGQTVVPTLTGVIELVCRVGAASVLGAAYGYDGVVWGNPLAWIGAVVLLVPAYVVASRRLALQPVTGTDAVVLEGPSEGSVVMDAVVRVPRRPTRLRRHRPAGRAPGQSVLASPSKRRRVSGAGNGRT